MPHIQYGIKALFVAYISLLLVSPVYGATYTATTSAEITSYTNMLTAGDTLLVETGTYDMSTWRIQNRNGSPSAWILIQPVNGPVTIRGTAYENVMNIDNSSYIHFRGFEVTCSGVYPDIDGIKFSGGTNSSYFKIEDCYIHDLTGNGCSSQADEIHHVELRNCEIANCDLCGVYWGYPSPLRVARDCIIDHCYIHDTSVGTTGYGIQIKGGSYRNIIQDTVLHDVAGTTRAGIAVYYVSLTGGNPVSDNNIIRRNIIWNCRNEGIYAAAGATIENNIVFDSVYGINIWTYTSSTMENMLIYNNTVYRCSDRGIVLGDFNLAGSDCKVINNASFMEDTGLYALRAPSGIGTAVVQNNYYYGLETGFGAGAIAGKSPDLEFIAANPAVVAGTIDLYPLTTSSLKDTGKDLTGVVDHDFDFTARPFNSLFDVGAYEWSTARNPGWHINPEFKKIDAAIPAGNIVSMILLLSITSILLLTTIRITHCI